MTTNSFETPLEIENESIKLFNLKASYWRVLAKLAPDVRFLCPNLKFPPSIYQAYVANRFSDPADRRELGIRDGGTYSFDKPELLFVPVWRIEASAQVSYKGYSTNIPTTTPFWVFSHLINVLAAKFWKQLSVWEIAPKTFCAVGYDMKKAHTFGSVLPEQLVFNEIERITKHKETLQSQINLTQLATQPTMTTTTSNNLIDSYEGNFVKVFNPKTTKNTQSTTTTNATNDNNSAHSLFENFILLQKQQQQQQQQQNSQTQPQRQQQLMKITLIPVQYSHFRTWSNKKPFFEHLAYEQTMLKINNSLSSHITSFHVEPKLTLSSLVFVGIVKVNFTIRWSDGPTLPFTALVDPETHTFEVRQTEVPNSIAILNRIRLGTFGRLFIVFGLLTAGMFYNFYTILKSN